MACLLREKCGQPADYSGSCFCINSIISAFVGIASTDPNLVQASAPAADANLTGYLLLEKALKSNYEGIYRVFGLKQAFGKIEKLPKTGFSGMERLVQIY